MKPHTLLAATIRSKFQRGIRLFLSEKLIGNHKMRLSLNRIRGDLVLRRRPNLYEVHHKYIQQSVIEQSLLQAAIGPISVLTR